ncbi:MAG: hypothetical protein IPK61_10900 [Saprospiraceae bacterium]|nr:hypothetical protein [Saprospiraceae bacterium]
MDQFSFQYPTWFLFLCIGAALFVSLLVYYKSRQFSERPFWHKLILASLRFLASFLIFFLLLHPLFKKYEQDIKKPLVVIAQDMTASLCVRDSQWMSDYYKDQEKESDKWKQKYDVKWLGFGDHIVTEFSPYCNHKKTNITQIFDNIQDQSDLQNLKAVVLCSDGIYNAGKNPLYHSLLSGVKVHTVLLGDSTQEKDLRVQRIFHNEIIYTGDQFAVECDIQSSFSKGNKYNVRLSQWDNGKWKTLKESTRNIESDYSFQTEEFVIQADKPGLQKFLIQCSSISGERNTRNNSREFFVEFLDARKKILIYAQSAHPDIAAMREALLSNKNYEVDVNYTGSSIQGIEKYALAILHQCPSSASDDLSQIQKLKNAGVPLLYIIGAQTDLNSFNNIQDIVQITGSNKSMNDAQAVFKKGFSAFTISDQLSQTFDRLPPLSAPFGNYKLNPNAQVFLFQKIGKIETNYPLWIMQDQTGSKSAVICGEGLWKWKFNNYLQENNFELFYEIISKTVQFTSTKDDKRKFKVSQNKRLYDETENIVLNAELYNDNYERINEPDVNFQLFKNTGEKYPYTFGKKDNIYELQLGNLAAGDYSYKAETSWNGKSWTQDGKFSVSKLDIETENVMADHNLLRSISEKTGGISILKNNWQELTNNLLQEDNSKPIVYQTLHIKSLLDEKFLFFLIFLLLALEWFLRRFWGSY